MSRIPDVVVERVHLGEATEAERASVLADADASARLEALRADDAAFHAAHPADVVVPEIERRLHLARTRDAVASRNRTLGLSGLVLAPLLAAILAFVVIGPGAGTPDRVDDPVDGIVTAKGLKPKLHVYRLEPTGARSINPGIVLRRGDRLQLATTSGDATHGVILSVDGRSTVTLHHPSERTGDTRLGHGHSALPEAYELDDAPVFERFFLIASDHPLDVARTLAAAEALAASGEARTGELEVADDVVVKDFLVRKEER